MIRFFSKIRYQLAAENRFGKYLRYAVGEILLVVIGILIALQVNNWNEERKIHAFERKILTDVLHTIDNDIANQEMLIRRLDTMSVGISNIYRLIGKNESSPDSIQKYINYLRTGIGFYWDRGAYESLKSVGLDKISNDSIRADLARLYDFAYPRIQAMINSEYLESYDEAFHLLDGLLITRMSVEPDGETTLYRVFEINDPFQNPEFLSSMRLFSMANERARYRLDNMRTWLDYNKNSLERYLKK